MSVIAREPEYIRELAQSCIAHEPELATADLFRAISCANQMAYALGYREQMGEVLTDREITADPSPLCASECVALLRSLVYNMSTNAGTYCLPANYDRQLETLTRALSVRAMRDLTWTERVRVGCWSVQKSGKDELCAVNFSNQSRRAFHSQTADLEAWYDNLMGGLAK